MFGAIWWFLLSFALVWVTIKLVAGGGNNLPKQCDAKAPPIPRLPRILKNSSGISKLLNVAPRRMWGWGGWANTMLGYCGESSLQMCAVYYGNYFSQEQITKAAGSSFMLGVNDGPCFGNLHLNYKFWPNIFGSKAPGITEILKWICDQIDANCPVIAGLFVNEDQGDLSFDHQCVFCGYEKSPTDGSLQTLWLLDTYEIRFIPLDCRIGPYQCLSGQNCPDPLPDPVPPKYPGPNFPVCYMRREDYANPNKQAPYSVAIPNIMHAKDPKSGYDLGNAFAVVYGNNDPNHELYPCILQMNSVFEPNWGSEDQVGAPPGPISCNVYVEGLQLGETYSILRFDFPADVPKNGNFINSTKYTLRHDFVACDDHYMLAVQHDPKVWPFMSNGTYFFRCVKTNNTPMRQNFPYGTDRTDKKKANPQMALVMAGSLPRNVFFKTRYERYLQNLVLAAQQPRRRRTKPPRNIFAIEGECSSSKKPTVPAGIACGDSSQGNIAGLWEWKFPTKDWAGNPLYGCFQVALTVQNHGSEAENCVNFQVANTGHSSGAPSLNSVTGVIIYDSDGVSNPRLYVEDWPNVFTYSFSPAPQNADGTFTMLSQDGVTVSVLRPIGS